MKKIIVVCALITTINACQKSIDRASFIVSGYTDKAHPEGLHRLEINFKKQSAKVVSSLATIKNPSYMIFGKDHNSLYVTSETANFNNTPQGSIAKVNLKGSKMLFDQQVPSGGKSPCHLAYLPNHNKIMVANYSSGNIVALDLDENQNFSSNHELQVINYHNSSVNLYRQDKSYSHFVAQSPWSESTAFSVDLGGDRIYRCQTDKGLKLTDSISVPVGSGCRHLAFHPFKKWFYSANELNSTVSFFEVDKLEKMQYVDSYKTLHTPVKNYPGGIRIDSKGKFLYVSNRGENTIACFEINQENGQLTFSYSIPTSGDWPRFFTFSKDERHLLVANQKSNNITVFSINPNKKKFKKLDIDIKIHAPVCILEL